MFESHHVAGCLIDLPWHFWAIICYPLCLPPVRIKWKKKKNTIRMHLTLVFGWGQIDPLKNFSKRGMTLLGGLFHYQWLNQSTFGSGFVFLFVANPEYCFFFFWPVFSDEKKRMSVRFTMGIIFFTIWNIVDFFSCCFSNKHCL